jgi:IclR family acetate operon transcriptional repressor
MNAKRPAKKGNLIEMSEREVTGPRSLTRLLGLFDALAKKPDGLTLAELNTVLESPKSSLLNLLRPLVAEGYLMHSHGLYRLGPTAFRLAANIMSVWNFSKLARPYLEELAARTKESVYIGVLDREAQVITYVDAIDSGHSVRYAITVGANRPLYCTAAGRLLLAFADAEFQENYLRTVKMVRRTEQTLTDKKELRKRLDEIRRTGLATSVSEMFQGSAALAAPIFGSEGKVIAAIAVGAPADRFESELPYLRNVISDIATRVSGAQLNAPSDSVPLPNEAKVAGSRRATVAAAANSAITPPQKAKRSRTS